MLEESEHRREIEKIKNSNKASFERLLSEKIVLKKHIEKLRNQMDAEKDRHESLMDRLRKSTEESKQWRRSANSNEKRGSALDRQNKKMRKVIDKLQRDLEKYRFAAMALKHVAQRLPFARINEVEWTKCTSGSPNTPITLRTVALNRYREDILAQSKYRNLKLGQYLIENNPSNGDCQYGLERLDQIKLFVEHNHIGNSDPSIKIDQSGYIEPLSEVAGIRTVEQCKHLKLLEGQLEAYAKFDIPGGVILGQYVGNEMLKPEYYSVYNGTKDECEHATYMHGASLHLSNGQEIDIYIDGIAAGTSTPLLYINDGRVNIREDETAADRNRMNAEYVNVLCNGWPLILVMTTKDIKRGDSIWINYGPSYGLVLDSNALMYDQQKKMIRSVDQILTGIDLNETRPIHIFDDENSDTKPLRHHGVRPKDKGNRATRNLPDGKKRNLADSLRRIPKRSRSVIVGVNNPHAPIPKRRRLNNSMAR